jgi:hypothetical protein
MFELFSDMYFVVYKLYYVDQNDNLSIRARLRNWDGGSMTVATQNPHKGIKGNIVYCTQDPMRQLHARLSIFITQGSSRNVI